MISQVNTALAKSVLQEPIQKAKSQDNTNGQPQVGTSRVDELKASIEDGSYKIDLKALAQKIAKELV